MVSQHMVRTLQGCYAAFSDLDATMVEINPLVVTGDDARVVALDAKMSFDDNALFRHPQIAELRDKSQEDPRESRAADRGLSYVGLDGNIGCIVNGAGLAMATMDTIKLAGGEPANFLDIGGGASPERVAKAFRLVLSDSNVQAVLVNIFAGINRCDWVAEGVVQALQGTRTRHARRRALGRHQCGRGAEDPRQVRPADHPRHHPDGSRRARRGRLAERPDPSHQNEGREMSILLDRDSRVIVQGITGRMARFHTKDMLAYGTNVVGGVVPGKGGEVVEGVPVFDTVKEAVAATGADASPGLRAAALCR